MQDPIYAIGDIHGQIEALDQALSRIEADGGADARIVFLGDLVDRGADSRGVIERIRAGQDGGRPWQVIKGNHDRLFFRFVREGIEHDDRIQSGNSWRHPSLGGVATLAAYGVADAADRPLDDLLAETRAAVPQAHIDWIGALPLWIEAGPLLFVHAGIFPGQPLDLQTEDDLLWIRHEFLTYAKPHPWLIVHGHTALDHPTHFGNRIDLDGGAGYGRPLVPAVFEGRDAWLLEASGRVPLTP
jgi:serine/threonine protein phosphatase 1